MYTKGIWEETLFFLKGQTDVRILQSKNADPKYKRNITKILKIMILDLFMDINGENKDQLMYIINELKNKSFNRRLFMSAWNPLQLDDMVLPPCHVSYNFIPYLKNENYTVDLMMYQRSADVILGLPFNIASCAFILKIICYYCNCVPCNIQICIGNAHIYNEHIKCKNITNILTWDKTPEYVTVDIFGDKTLAFDNFLETVNYKLNNYNINNKLSFPLIV